MDTKGSPALGLALSTGGSKGLDSEGKHTFFYAFGAGAGRGAGTGLTRGPYIAPGVELQLNK